MKIIHKHRNLDFPIEQGDLFEDTRTGWFYILMKNIDSTYQLSNMSIFDGYLEKYDSWTDCEYSIKSMVKIGKLLHISKYKYELEVIEKSS